MNKQFENSTAQVLYELNMRMINVAQEQSTILANTNIVFEYIDWNKLEIKDKQRLSALHSSLTPFKENFKNFKSDLNIDLIKETLIKEEDQKVLFDQLSSFLLVGLDKDEIDLGA